MKVTHIARTAILREPASKERVSPMFILGAFIGNLFGRKKPKIPTANAEVSLQIPQAEYALIGIYTANGGNRDLVKAMDEAARDTLNGLIQVIACGGEEDQISIQRALAHSSVDVSTVDCRLGELWTVE